MFDELLDSALEFTDKAFLVIFLIVFWGLVAGIIFIVLFDLIGMLSDRLNDIL